jgi:hypothetical protein
MTDASISRRGPVCEVPEELPAETLREPLASLDGGGGALPHGTEHGEGALGVNRRGRRR